MEKTTGNMLSAQDEQAVEQFIGLANQWRLSDGDDAPNQARVITRDTAIKFLMARKFDIHRAFELYQHHQIVREKKNLMNIDPFDEDVKMELENGNFTVLASRGFEGVAIAMFTGRMHTAKQYASTMKAILFQLDAALNDRDTQRQGLVLLYDMSGMTWSNSDMKLARDLLEILKGAFPARLKKILVVNAPSWLNVPYKILKPFLSAKMVDRLFVISSSHLPEHIPQDALPQDLGGLYVHSHDQWLQRCLQSGENGDQPAVRAPPIPLRPSQNGGSNGFMIASRDNKRDAQLFDNHIGQKLDEFADLKNPMSIHRRNDKGMGVVEFTALLYSMGKAGILREYDAMRTQARALPDERFSVFKATENRIKNRYVDVPCFDETRVRLRNCLPKDDYIHANFVDGYEQKNAYISTQGPLPKTFSDFWMMVWEEDVRVLVMTTRAVERGKTKCGQYWPADSQETAVMGDYQVTNDGIRSLGHHVETQLIVMHKNESRKVVHLQFTDWPDYGVPHSAQSMFDLIQSVRQCQLSAVKTMKPSWSGHSSGPPIVVHCSAGIGRSGTLIALDICLRRLDDCGLVDVRHTVEKLRSQRCQSIQMPEQYLFCCLAVAEYCVTKGFIGRTDCHLDDMLQWLQDEDE